MDWSAFSKLAGGVAALGGFAVLLLSLNSLPEAGLLLGTTLLFVLGAMLVVRSLRPRDGQDVSAPAAARGASARRTGEGLLREGAWAFVLTNVSNPEQRLQFYGIFHLRQGAEGPEIAEGQTWVAGAPPADWSRWGHWKTHLTALKDGVLLAHFPFRMQYSGPSAPVGVWEAILLLQRDGPRKLTGSYQSLLLPVSRHGPMHAWWVDAEDRERASREASRTASENGLTPETAALLDEMRKAHGDGAPR